VRPFGAEATAHGFEACFAELFDHFARPDAWRLDDDALDTLSALRASGLRLAVVSNFDGRLLPLLAGLGIAPLVDAVVPSAAHDAAKPDPRLFHAAARLLGARPADVLHVGDDLDLDVRGALAAGFRAMLFDPTGQPRAGRDHRPAPTPRASELSLRTCLVAALALPAAARRPREPRRHTLGSRSVEFDPEGSDSSP
jgi:putative hydrolase of the HAD superfamily